MADSSPEKSSTQPPSNAPESSEPPTIAAITPNGHALRGRRKEELRLAIIKKDQEDPDLSHDEIAAWLLDAYGVKMDRSTVGRNRWRGAARTVNPVRESRIRTAEKKEEEAIRAAIVAAEAKPKKRLKRRRSSHRRRPEMPTEAADLDEAVYDFFLEKARNINLVEENNAPPVLAFRVDHCREKAAELAETGLYPAPNDSVETDEWLECFLSRFNLEVTVLLSVEGSPVSIVVPRGPSSLTIAIVD